jgi:hypothetical protein
MAYRSDKEKLLWCRDRKSGRVNMRKNDLKEFDIDVPRIDAVVKLFLAETLNLLPVRTIE